MTFFLARVRWNEPGARWTVFNDIPQEPQDLVPLFRALGSGGRTKVGPKLHRKHLDSRVAELCAVCQACTGHNETWAKLEQTARRLACACGI